MDKVKYICTQGLNLLCDIKPDCIAHDRMIYRNFNINNKYGDTIYLHPSMVYNFIHNFLDKMSNQFVIVIGGDDSTMPDDYRDIEKLLEHNKVLKIFSQNNILNHDKIEHLPIGLDYHSLYFYNGIHDWSDINSPINPLIQEQEMIDIKNSFINLEDTDPLAITNFHLAMSGPPRRREFRNPIYNILKDKNCVIWLSKQIRSKFWKNMNDYTFVICPFGNGLDTHRAWEVLCLGRIPIIEKSGLNKVYENLPVVEVSDWNIIDEKFLEEQKQKILKNIKLQKYNFDKLTIEYWKKRFKSFKN